MVFRSYTNEFKHNLRDKLDISEITDIFTSEDMENMPPESWMWFRMNFTWGGGVLPYMGYIGMCGPKEYGFSAILVINRVSILADFGHFGRK